MKLEHLEYLVEVARYQSMNVAAEKLHITQQALSLAIKSVEAEVGAKVLERSYRGVSLTSEGEKVVDLAGEFLQQFQALKQTFSNRETRESKVQEKINGTIKCLINPGLNHTIFPRIMTQLYKQYPKIKVDVEEYTAKEILRRVNEQQGDLGMINVLSINEKVYGLDKNLDIEFVPFFQYKLCAIVNKQSSLAKYKTISISTLLKEPFVLCSEKEELEEYLLTKLIRHYGSPNIISVNSPYLSKQMVIDNMGVSIILMNDPLHITGMDDVIKIPINNRFKMQTGYIYSRNKPLSEVSKKFIEVIHQKNSIK